MRRPLLILLQSLFLALCLHAQHYTISSEGIPQLTAEGASHFASLAMKCIVQEYPNKTGHIQSDSSDRQTPAAYHPAFYGCFDWHSAVHGHWMLVKLLKQFPTLPEAAEIRQAIDNHLTAEKIRTEVEYLNVTLNRTFERTYGWAWLLKLAEELHTWDDSDGARWATHLEPLVQKIVTQYFDYLPKQHYPTRTGVHSNTAFGLSFALDYAITTKNSPFEKLIKQQSQTYFLEDRDCPGAWEPGGADFFSPCLLEAELMAKVLPSDDFESWLNNFLPQLKEEQPTTLFRPVSVSDRNDLQLVHLDGLNLSRAWCFLLIAKKITDTTQQAQLKRAALIHLKATIPQIADGDYAGEHWLASFAVYALMD